ncbi:MAG: PH domain-containing protein [Gemmatimonadota bacterium]|nr:PH domain-containing protein [Gemmatimonadota bacterium]
MSEALGQPGVVPAERIDDGVTRSLHPRSVTVERISGGVFSSIVATGLIAGAVVLDLFSPLSAAATRLIYAGTVSLSFLLVWWLYRWPAIAHRHKSYTVGPASIEIRKGVVWRRVVSIPRSRVQHTDVTQGPLERRFELGTLVIYTAGTEHSKIDLPGLPHVTASRIRDHLLPIGDSDAV